MYKYFFILFLIYSCSASHHIQKMQKHKAKAELKGAKFEDSISYRYITQIDTITDTLTNEKYIRTTVVDSVPYIVSKLVYVPMSRQERLAYQDSLKTERTKIRQENRTERKETKQENKTERKEIRSKSGWKNWLIVILFGGLVFLLYLFSRKTVKW